MNLNGKTILITGGSSGIGKSTAALCSKLGAVVLIMSENKIKIDETVKEISNLGGKVRGYTCDISQKQSVVNTLKSIFDEYKTIDVLINNAGYATYQTFLESSLDEIEKLTLVNYLGTVYFLKITLDEMTKQRTGHVINVASVAGILPITPNAAYGASKHALVALTETLRAEYSRFGIRFSLMLPGRVDTPFFDHESFKRRKKRPEHSGMISPGTVAQLIVKQIQSKNDFTVVPGIFKWVAWLYQALPFIFRPLINFVLKKRINEHYEEMGEPDFLRATTWRPEENKETSSNHSSSK